MKCISWNVNGIRAVSKRGLADFVSKERPDVLCLQETRAMPEDADLTWAADLGYDPFWHPAEKKGYAGTLILARPAVHTVKRGLGSRTMPDREGRVLAAELDDFWMVNAYVPNAQRELTRLGYRQEWDKAFLAHLKRLQKTLPVVVCGDFNVAHTEIDLARPKENVRTHGFTIEERTGFSAHLKKGGLIDTFREFVSDGGHYTWWSHMSRARERNIGWRIDYFLISVALRPRLKRAWIMPQVGGSDHCPVGVELAE